MSYVRRGLLLLVGVVLAGCATHADYLHQVRNDFYAGNLDRALAEIDRQADRRKPDTDVLRLERSVVELAAGRPKQAEQTLRQVRDRFDYLEQKSLAESGLAMMTDDNAAAYAGEDYEKVLIRAMLALSSLMADGTDALAYSHQINEKQDAIVQAAGGSGENPKLAYKQVALGPYLHAALREESHANYDDVARAMATVVSWEPDFRYGRDDLRRAEFGRHSAPGNGVLYVFALVGRGPYKEEAVEAPSSVALLIADRILSHTAEHTLPPTIAPLKVPAVVLSANRIRGVEVSVDGHAAGRTETITDVGRLAVDQYRAVYDQVLARAVVRRVVKKGVIYGAKDALDVENNSWANLLLDVGGVAWEATEAADTRCWGLLPDKIQVLRLELPAGDHTLTLRPASPTGPFGTPHTTPIPIHDGRNTYVLANFPDDRLVGKILTSGHAL